MFPNEAEIRWTQWMDIYSMGRQLIVHCIHHWLWLIQTLLLETFGVYRWGCGSSTASICRHQPKHGHPYGYWDIRVENNFMVGHAWWSGGYHPGIWWHNSWSSRYCCECSPKHVQKFGCIFGRVSIFMVYLLSHRKASPTGSSKS